MSTAFPQSTSVGRPVLRDHRLVALLAELCRLQLHGRVVTETVAGKQDIRLQVWQGTGELTVELLWCAEQDPAPTRLEAVRVRGLERQTWCNPGARCTPVETVRFLADLLLCDESALPRRYRRLG